MTIEPNDIRHATFGLSVRGWNPEQVDALLYRLADALERGEPITAEMLDVSQMEAVTAGFAVSEVRRFLEQFSSQPDENVQSIQAASAPDDPSPEQESAAEPVVGDPITAFDQAIVAAEQAAEPAHAVEGDTEEAQASAQPVTEPDEAAEPKIDAPAPNGKPSLWPIEAPAAQSLPMLDPSVLEDAVALTRKRVVELEGFVEAQLTNAKAALDAAVTSTVGDCAAALQTARAIIESALATTEQEAEQLRTHTNAGLRRMSETFDERLKTIRGSLARSLSEYHSETSREIDEILIRARDEAREITAKAEATDRNVQALLLDTQGVLTRRAAA